MEVVSGVASIITLIEATGVLARVSKDLVLRWRNAPHDIQALATRLSLVAAEMQSIKNATARSHPVLTDGIIRQSLSDLLQWSSFPLHLQRKHMRAEELDAACGPETEVWYLNMIHGRGFLTIEKKRDVAQRLSELSQVGLVRNVFVYEDKNESGHTNVGFLARNEIRIEDAAVRKRGSNDDIDNESNEGFTDGTISKADEVDEFWDAQESAW